MVTLGLDLGGTKILAAVVAGGKTLRSVRVDTPQTGFDDVLAALAGCARELLASDDGSAVAAIGVGSPGPLDRARQRVLFAPNIVGMQDAPLVERLTRELQMPVYLENDANAAGYAEHRFGAAHGLSSSVYVTVSTGIGGGLFLGEKIVRGANGLAGEIGHISMLLAGPMGGDGHAGTLEALAAGRSMARDASYAYGRDVDTRELFALAQSGERRALGIVDNSALFVGIGLANLVKIFDPEAFVLGGGISSVGDFYLDKVRAAAQRFLVGYPQPTVLQAQLGGEAGVIGAAAIAAHELSSGGPA